MSEQFISTTFTLTPEIRATLESWAKEQDRSVSSVLRQILKKEIERRKQEQKGGKRDNSQH